MDEHGDRRSCAGAMRWGGEALSHHSASVRLFMGGAVPGGLGSHTKVTPSFYFIFLKSISQLGRCLWSLKVPANLGDQSRMIHRHDN